MDKTASKLAEQIICRLHEEGAFENEPGKHVLAWNAEDIELYERIIDEELAGLRKTLSAANTKLSAFADRANKDYRFQQDYLPYDDDERR